VTSIAIGTGTRDAAGVWTPEQARRFLVYTKAAGGSRPSGRSRCLETGHWVLQAFLQNARFAKQAFAGMRPARSLVLSYGFIIWCGEGDLFSRPTLKTRKLYTSRRAKNTKSARSTRLSHTASHTMVAGRFRPCKTCRWFGSAQADRRAGCDARLGGKTSCVPRDRMARDCAKRKPTFTSSTRGNAITQGCGRLHRRLQ
jgi:hypothetical protein